ncbi:MAG: hypothetical protein KIS78_16145 [Labilithrix sp.]|nr:hypothetical protein [Labilithrix sp.]
MNRSRRHPPETTLPFSRLWRRTRDSKPGAESPGATTESAREHEKTAADAIGKSTGDSTVWGEESSQVAARAVADAALRAAAKAAIDAGDFKHAAALVALLDAADVAPADPVDASESTKIVALSTRRRG